ncbi:bifunctional folylpolyglutamate synthase/dihydrofolate synthase [Evansella sp. AB-P1]|uniref:bifunctional folylpolyglutamate synthase/dihydrofolate synthase n=1 Tax=Evansella sp. AB-P1 TaxID=3037653 RepID=UPI00241C2AFD|nr:folylpolyglutamate synthase/dihydrofolate synthase family protein [Evansella sp. AB-P1]MDG5786871.1 bifunctional folylpolyglutamate synthase/dihydrofolate synthase [Evansella sp. AB-P1]
MKLYKEACDYVLSLKKNRNFNGLGRMEKIVEELKHPEKEFNTIHIAGTNGKGSTLTYIKAILMEAGLTVGTFTSPYVQKYNDQIQVNGQTISDEEFLSLVEDIKPIVRKLEKKQEYGVPVEFEIMTAIALHYFSKRKVDIAILETGLGGRLDPTNIIRPLVSVITNVGYDHMEFLGETLSEIGQEKAGIIKKDIPVVSGCKQREVIHVVEEVAKQHGAVLYQLNDYFFIDQKKESFSVHTEKHTYGDLSTGMLGFHQMQNGALAIMALECLTEKHLFQITKEQIKKGLMKGKIPNRIEVVQKDPLIIFDGGHNSEGLHALVNTLSKEFSNKRFTFLFSATKNKNINEMIDIMRQIGNEIIICPFKHEQGMDPVEVYHSLPSTENIVVQEDWKHAYTNKSQSLRDNEALVVTGSLYLLREIRNELRI